MKTLPIVESYWVEENRFLAGEYPGSHNPEYARRRMDAFIEAGIHAFVDLTHSHELVPYESILKEQARIYDVQASYHRFAIRDHGVPSHETMVAILDTIDDEISRGRGVYVHCWGGVGRTGVTVGCYLVRHGMDNKKALARVDALFKTRPQTYFSTSPETQEQFDFVLNWRESSNSK